MSEWKKCTIGDLCDTISETYKKGHDKVVLINTSDVLEGKVLNNAHVENKQLKGQFKKTFKKDDILYSEIRPANRRYAFIDFENTEDYIASTKLMVLRPRKDVVLPEFLYLMLTSQTIIDELQHLAETRSGTFPQITFSSELATMPIMLPPFKIQKQITSVISVLDGKIELNNRINENLEQQIQAILLNMIQQDSEKDSIETVKLGEYLYIKGRIGWKGLKKDEYLDSSDYRIINGESLTKDGIDWNKAGFISKERYDESPEIMLQVGDILLSKDGTIGKIGYVDNLDSPSTVASGIFVIRNIKPDIISTQFIYYLLKSKLFSAFIASRTEGSVIPHLYQKDFMEFAFPLPNADEMSQFDALTSPLFATIIKNLRENEFLTATRDALLPKLMNGEIDVSAVRI